MNNDFRTYHTRLDTDVCFSSIKFEKRLFLSVDRCPISCDSYLFYLGECEKKATFMSPEKAKEVLKSMTPLPRSDDWNPTRVEPRSRVVTETYNQFTVVDLPPDECKCKCKCDLDMGDIVDSVWEIYHRNDWVVIEDRQLAKILTDKIVDARRTRWCEDEIFKNVLVNIEECIENANGHEGCSMAGDTIRFDHLISELKDRGFFTEYNLNLLKNFDLDRACARLRDSILVVRTE